MRLGLIFLTCPAFFGIIPYMKKNHEFKVIIERDNDGYFVASVPALPGCHTQAKDLTALKKRIQEAISLCLEVASADPEYGRRIARFSYEPSFIGIESVSV